MLTPQLRAGWNLWNLWGSASFSSYPLIQRILNYFHNSLKTYFTFFFFWNREKEVLWNSLNYSIWVAILWQSQQNCELWWRLNPSLLSFSLLLEDNTITTLIITSSPPLPSHYYHTKFNTTTITINTTNNFALPLWLLPPVLSNQHQD